MSALVLDLETLPTEAAMAARPADVYVEEARKQPSNLKDPAKIAEWWEKENVRQVEARTEWEGNAAARAAEYAKSCALNPRLGRIVTFGWWCADSWAESVTAREECDEVATLQLAWRAIAEANGRIITFNGLSFDVPFFLTRSLILGVTPTVSIRTVRDWTRRYSFGPHFDCRAVLTQWDNRTTGTLSDWCSAMGIECPTGSGSDVYEQYQAGNFDAIAEHCRSDVTATAALYERVSQLYGECQ